MFTHLSTTYQIIIVIAMIVLLIYIISIVNRIQQIRKEKTKMNKKKKTKLSRSENFIANGFVYVFVWGTFLAIWIDEYRWKIFFTGLFCLILSMVMIAYERSLKDNSKK